MSRLKTVAETFTALEAVDMTFKAPDRCWIKKITASFSATPTTAEDFTINFVSKDGAAYGHSFTAPVDPVAVGMTDDLRWTFTEAEGELCYEDSIDLDYTNTDGAVIGVLIQYEVKP